MDWTGYPIALAPEDQVAALDDLGLFLGAQSGSFTAEVLELIDSAQTTPSDRERLTVAFPREVIAWSAWKAQPEPPTAGGLLAVLAAAPDPVEPDPDIELVTVQPDRVQIVRLTGDNDASLSLRYRLATGQSWRSYTTVMPTPAVQVDGRLLNAGGTGYTARATLLITVDDQAPAE
ncbi:hypothetical protein [Micromonospora sp. NPDC049645]|uniref:hypothetical protein n=1 Tax=Micromonospora sp. NPDC049645 TaxID=3155508 RepID=UPI00343EC254